MMRIVIDMQGAQSESRMRGIGRYSLSFARSIARNRGEHDVVLALNGQLTETIEPIRRYFADLLPRENIRVWEAPGPVRALDLENDARRNRAEILYETFLASLDPDIVHIPSLFEGFADSAVTSIGRLAVNAPISATLHDLIPLHDPARYLEPNPQLRSWYFEKLEQLKKADLLLAISEFSLKDAHGRLEIQEGRVVNSSLSCAEIFRKVSGADAERTGVTLRLGIDRPFIMTSGTIEPHKNLERLFRAFASLPAELRKTHQLVLVGKFLDTQRQVLAKMMREAELAKDEVIITGHVSDDDLVALYNLCKLMVFPSLDEGFGLPALEAMACGAPTIGSRAASIPEVIGRDDALFDPYDKTDIARLLARALADTPFRTSLKAHAAQQAKNFSWNKTAEIALREMEAIVQKRKTDDRQSASVLHAGIEKLAEIPGNEKDLLALAQSMAWTFPNPTHERQLLVDVSELAQRDARTGCQRVTRSILLELLKSPPAGFLVEPVYATAVEMGYRYARDFTSRLTGKPKVGEDDQIDLVPGDLFFGLDYQAHIAVVQTPFLLKMKRQGVGIRFLVHDVLSVTMPHHFMPGNADGFVRWLETIAKFDGIIAISKATADDLKAWYARHSTPLDDSFCYQRVSLGADIENSAPTFGLPDSAPEVLSTLSRRPTFLMVGTIEPRKGYAQALASFDRLWSRGVDVNFVIVGKEGWNVASLVDRLRKHPERMHRLFWLEGISDEYLEKVYAAADCLIAASEGEGFGLPLIEAARHKLPILARDMPVFREVAGEHAAWFGGLDPESLANAVVAWLALYKQDRHPRSDDMPWITWAESARQMADAIVGAKNAK